MAPLNGVTVLDLSRVLAGPWCTMALGDLGAEVWKVESPRGGDDTRNWSPPALDGVSTYYLAANRNKKSLAVDLLRPEGRAIVLDLARRADVVVENFRASSLHRLGFDYESLKAVNSRIIHCSISGYGRDGSFADRPGYDLVLQAECGFMAITGDVDGKPARLGVAFIDLVAGMNAAQAILAALHVREKTGLGQRIDIALADSGLHALANVASGYLNTGVEPKRFGNAHPSIAPYQTFDTADGQIVLAVGNDEQYRRLCVDVLGDEALWNDARFRTNQGRVEHRDAFIPMLQARIRSLRTRSLIESLNRSSIPVGEIRTVSAALHSAEASARGVVVSAHHGKLGRVRMVRSPLRFSATPTVAPSAPPMLGEHTREVLRTVLGYADADIDQLKHAGVLAT